MELDLDLAASALGSAPASIRPFQTGGYTRSRTWLVEAAGGPAFVKQADDEGGLAMLRREALVYGHVSGPFLPGHVGFADVGARAVLALEYLPDAHWPPPYPGDVSPLFAALERVASTPPPPGLPAEQPRWSRWERVAADPGPLLSLPVCSREWLERSLDSLLAAEAEAVFEGDALTHNDIYCDNVCFTARGAVLVDWGAARRASPWVDVAQAVLSVREEGGSLPPIDFPGEAAYAAALAGHFAVEAPAPLPDWIAGTSTFRQDMTGTLVYALRWAADCLRLPPLS